jgi:hypothetical protein
MLRMIAAVAVLMIFTLPVAADAIDGDWCSPEGQHLSINGPEITTPAKITMQGNYHRHEFTYVAPKGDADSGSQVYLRLLSDDEMNFYHASNDGTSGDPVIWRRCKPVS